MKKLLILTGDMATGKSTFSAILSKRYNIEYSSKDIIKEKLVDKYGYANREENRKLSLIAVQQIIDLFSEKAKRGESFICEANFHDFEIDQLCDIAKANGYKSLVLLFTADLKILFERSQARISSGTRHKAHIHEELQNFEDFKKLLLDRRKVNPKHHLINVNCDDFSYQTDNKFLSLLDNFFDE